MREIKFRGKQTPKGEWIYGNYIEKLDPKEKEPTFWAALIHDGALTATQVIPETVGQYTGIKDKNGKEIYEGDIFKLGAEKEVFEVRFEYGCFMAFCKGKQYGLIGELQILFIEVIGNIHDNPELLKQNDND